MYVHIGQKKSLKDSYIVGIFDLDGDETTRITAEFLSSAQKAGIVSSVGEDIPRSFILCHDRKGEEVFLSHISSSTLGERAHRE